MGTQNNNPNQTGGCTLTTAKKTAKKTRQAKGEGREKKRGMGVSTPDSGQPYMSKKARLNINTDPEKSCKDPKEEHFCRLCAQKFAGLKAYQIAINPKSRNKSAVSRASELRRRPDLARRILVLQALDERPANARTLAPAVLDDAEPTKAPAPAPAATTATGPVTRDELTAKISQAVREATTATEKTQSVKLARDMLGLDAPTDAPVDPVALVAYVISTGGRRPAEIAAETGGLRWQLQTVADLSALAPSHVRRVVGAWYRSMLGEDTGEDTGAAATQTGEHLLSDDGSDNDHATTTTAADRRSTIEDGGEGDLSVSQ